ncbi:hypothetical protein VNO78_11480 [Psophocarpus tetragonolobus]|uniref:Uncharacterized protein n=1 Tax=Psophocarpus tetragonolobus TaxID=3891 RepID=A0AAN9SME2_PSOTE
MQRGKRQRGVKLRSKAKVELRYKHARSYDVPSCYGWGDCRSLDGDISQHPYSKSKVKRRHSSLFRWGLEGYGMAPCSLGFPPIYEGEKDGCGELGCYGLEEGELGCEQ